MFECGDDWRGVDADLGNCDRERLPKLRPIGRSYGERDDVLSSRLVCNVVRRSALMELPGQAEIECSNCHSSFYVSGSDVYVDSNGSDERAMGLEVFYFGVGGFRCPNCDHEIEVEYEASEYPVGALNFSETHISGGSLLSGFGDIEFQFGEEIYSFEEDAQLYLPKENEIITDLSRSVSALILAAAKRPEVLHEITPREFEELIAEILSKNGFMVELTQRTRDGGKDIVAFSSILGIRSKYIIECKRYAPNRPVGVSLVRNLYGVQLQEGANKSILATTSRFTADAIDFASKRDVSQWAMDLKDYKDIISWIKSSKRE